PPSLFPAPPTPDIYTLSLHDALPISLNALERPNLEFAILELALLVRREHRPELRSDPFAESTSRFEAEDLHATSSRGEPPPTLRSEEHTSELQSRENLVCRLLLEKKK